MSTDLSTKPNFDELSGHDLVRYNNAMVREILSCGLTGYREVTIFQNKEAGVKRCEANWSALKCGRDKVAAEAKEAGGARTGRFGHGVALADHKEPTADGSLTARQIEAEAKGSEIKINKPLMLKAMLERGATVEAMTAALDWQAHTLRARISTLAKDTGCQVQRTRKDGVTTYQIVS